MPNRFEIIDAAASKNTAYTLDIGDILQGNLATANDKDWYAVHLDAGETYSFALVGTGVDNVANPLLQLRNANGGVLASNDDGLQSQNSIVHFTATKSGTYFLTANGDAGQYGITAQAATRPSFDAEMGAGMIDSESSWSPTRGTPVEVTYAFREGPPTYEGAEYSTFYQLTQDQMDGVQRALQMWSEVANITFKQVNPGGYSDDATILFANYDGAPGDPKGAFALFPNNTASTAADGDVWFNTDSISTGKWTSGDYSSNTALHEIGHALGLSHPGQYNAGGSPILTYENNAEFVEDTAQYSLMTYFNEENTGASSFEGFSDTPMMLDILALQTMYGVNFSTRSGNTVYGYDSNAGDTYDLAKNTTQGFCIWDGGGIDRLDASKSTTANIINLAPGSFSTIDGRTSGVSIAVGAWIEDANGGFNTDVITGNDKGNVVFAFEANDQVYGRGGNDTLFGGADNDVINGEDGNDRLLGGSGVDTVSGDAGNDTIVVGPGETVQAVGGVGIDVLELTSFGAALNWNIPTDTRNFAFGSVFVSIEGALFGGSDDSFTGDGNMNSVAGGAGNDTLAGGSGSDILNGEEDADTLSGDNGNDTIAGGSGNDTIQAGAAEDRVAGGLNDDTLSGDSGHDVIYGDAGNDTIDGGDDHDIIGGGSVMSNDGGANSIDGGNGNDTLTGGGIFDTVNGGEGDDRLIWDGSDALDGGNGFDLLDLSKITFDVTVDIALNTTSLFNTTIANFEDVLAGSGKDQLEGTDSADRFDGGAGNDTIDGFGGNDTIAGGAGNDKIFGSGFNIGETGSPNDSLSGGDGNDTISGNLGADTINGDAGNDIIQADQAGFTAETAGHLLHGGSGNDFIQAAAGADLLFGDEDNDRLNGAAGNDTIDGGDGDDRMDGGDDADLLSGLSGNDVILGGGGNDTIFGAAFNTGEDGNSADSIKGGDGNDSISGNLGADTIFGEAGNDTIEADQEGFISETANHQLFGGDGNDVIVGASGDDSIVGGVGSDMLTGNDGADVYDFNALIESTVAATGRDRIHGFAVDSDHINLATIDAVTGGANNAFTFVGTGPITAAGQVQAVQLGVNTLIRLNVDSDLNFDMAILLANFTASTLDKFDFVL